MCNLYCNLRLVVHSDLSVTTNSSVAYPPPPPCSPFTYIRKALGVAVEVTFCALLSLPSQPSCKSHQISWSE